MMKCQLYTPKYKFKNKYYLYINSITFVCLENYIFNIIY